MRLEDILFNTICLIPKYSPEATITQIRADVHALEGYSFARLLFRKRFETKLAGVSVTLGQYDHLRLLGGRLFQKADLLATPVPKPVVAAPVPVSHPAPVAASKPAEHTPVTTPSLPSSESTK